MSFATYGQIKTKVLDDLDLVDEVFFTADELLGYCREAIHDAESTILRLCEDYFLDKTTASLVDGVAEIDLPSDIYADKIRAIVYKVGSTVYLVRRMRFSDMFEEISVIDALPGTQYYRYLITNDAVAGRKIQIVPVPYETSPGALVVWYIRNAVLPTLDADVVDIPEFRSFIEQFMKVRLLEKEGHPGLQYAKQVLEQYRQIMVDTLTNRAPDNDDEIEQDFRHYREHS